MSSDATTADAEADVGMHAAAQSEPDQPAQQAAKHLAQAEQPESEPEPEPDAQDEQSEPGLLVGENSRLRVYDSLDRQYSVIPRCHPIVSPQGALPGAERIMPADFSHRPWASALCPNPGEFSAYYGVYAQFLPFEHQADDRVESMTTIQEYLAARPPTCERVAQSVLRGPTLLDDDNPALPVEETCLLAGWWPGDWRSSSGVHYMNPDYCHGHAAAHCYTERVRRVQVARIAGALNVTASGLAAMFGMASGDSTRKTLWRWSVPWNEIRQEGLRRLARTAKTIYSWGHTWREVAAAFGVARSTVNCWARDHAAEFNPPPDPTVGGFERPLRDWIVERRSRSDGTYGRAGGDIPIARLMTVPTASSDLVEVRRRDPQCWTEYNNQPHCLPTGVSMR